MLSTEFSMQKKCVSFEGRLSITHRAKTGLTGLTGQQGASNKVNEGRINQVFSDL